MSRPKVAFVATGGTIAFEGAPPLELRDYIAAGRIMDAGQILARWPEVEAVAEIVPVAYKAVPSPAIGLGDWRALTALCERLAAEHPDLAGIVVGHGTSTLEETAYALNLTLKVALPVVLVGAQRPSSALSSDAGINLVNAVRVAASPEARGLGVLAVLNDEIHAAREVTKTSTGRVQAFRSPDFGLLGHADSDRIAFYRRPLRRSYPDTAFDIRSLAALPRVDIAYAYADADGTAVRAFVQAGAAGIVSASYAPGLVPPGEEEALKQAAGGGVAVVLSTHAGSGRTFDLAPNRKAGFLTADNLSPQKARILLALALTASRDPVEIARIFETY